MARRIGLRAATVDAEFPLGVAERLRADGVELTVDHEAIPARRRVKSPAELEGILRAQRAAEAGHGRGRRAAARRRAARRRAAPRRQAAHRRAVRAELRAACAERAAPAPPDVIVASVWQGFGHEAGRGPLPAGLPIEIDLWPQDEAVGLLGRHDAHVRDRRAAGRGARAGGAGRRGARGGPRRRAPRASRDASCTRSLRHLRGRRPPHAAHRSRRDPAEGFQFSLGHGVGLDVHEEPGARSARPRAARGRRRAGVEPGLWERAVGGVRFEDLLLVTDEGCETLTEYPYASRPDAGLQRLAGAGVAHDEDVLDLTLVEPERGVEAGRVVHRSGGPAASHPEARAAQDVHGLVASPCPTWAPR